jgi:hypothetical protein
VLIISSLQILPPFIKQKKHAKFNENKKPTQARISLKATLKNRFFFPLTQPWSDTPAFRQGGRHF